MVHVSDARRDDHLQQAAQVRRQLSLLRRTALFTVLVTCLVSGVAMANPKGGKVAAGQASISSNGQILTVTNTPGTVINWQQFSIQPDEVTRFIQSNAASAVLNRVGGTSASMLLGQLTSNGRVFLINPNGVTVGQGAVINTAGFVASSLGLSDENFRSGKFSFADTSGKAGDVVNHGSITSTSNGSIYLIAPNVENAGVINALGGEVLLAAGHRVELVSGAAPELRVELSSSQDGQALNVGQVLADAGKVGIFGTLVRNAGTVSANSARVDASGNVVLSASQDLLLDAGSITEAKSSLGAGGGVTLLGHRVGVLDGATADVSGAMGGGTLLVGGDLHGANPNVRNASATYVAPTATLRADAIGAGNGGKVVVWADGSTRYLGSIFARGGSLSGDGGNVEVSGKSDLSFAGAVDTSATHGRSGSLLLDPTNITIVAGATPAPPNASDGLWAFTEDTGNQSIGADYILSLLNTTNLTLQATNDITDGAAMNFTGSADRTLTMQANNNLSINQPITVGSSGARLNLLFAADAGNSGAGTLSLASNINTRGGFFTGTGFNISSTSAGTITTNGVAIGRAGGNIGLTASPGGTVNMAGAMSTNGGGSSAVNPSGSDAGSISVGGGSITLGALTTHGGTAVGTSGAHDGHGGAITITNTSTSTASTVTLNGNIDTTSGGSGGAGNGSKSGDVIVHGGLAAIVLNQSINATGGSGDDGGNVTIDGTNSLVQAVAKFINTSGGVASAINAADPGAGLGRNAGNIMVSAGSASLQQIIAQGTNAAAGSNRSGGNGGVLNVTANSVTFGSTISTTGGAADGNGNGGNAGAVAINANGASPAISFTAAAGATVDTRGGASAGSGAGGAGGNVTLNGATATGGNLSIATAGSNGAAGGNVVFTSTLDSSNGTPRAVTVDTGGLGDATFTGNVGQTSALGGLNVNARNIALGGGVRTVAGTPQAGAVVLTAAGTLGVAGTIDTSAANGNITLRAGAGSIGTLNTPVAVNGGTGVVSATTSDSVGNININSLGPLQLGTLSTNPASRQDIEIFSNGNLTVLDGSNSFAGDTLTLNARANTLTVQNTNYDIGINGGLWLVGNEINLTGGAGSIRGGAFAPVTLEPYTLTQSMNINGADTGLATTLDLTPTDLAALQPGFFAWFIGNSAGTGLITIHQVNLPDAVTFYSVEPGSAGFNIVGPVNALGDHIAFKTTGVLTQTAPVTANGLDVFGAGGVYNFTHAGNNVRRIAGDTGNLTYAGTGDVSIDTVNGDFGLTTSIDPRIVVSGNLTLNQPIVAAGSGDAVVLSGANFINNVGAAAISTPNGRWVIYSNAPSTNTFGGLASGSKPIWNASLATLPPPNIPAGNRYVFLTPQTLTFTSTHASKVYGDDATGAIAGNYAVTGFNTNTYGGAFLADDASVFSGAPSVASSGAPATAVVSGSPYVIDISAGTLAALTGYAFTFDSAGALSVLPRALTVVADHLSKIYGSSDPSFTYTVNGLVNGDGLSGVLTRAPGETVPGGPYAITQGSLAANPNYALAFTDGQLTITPKPIAVAADHVTKVYGSLDPAFTFSASGLVGSDTLTGSLARTPGETVLGGPYAITQGALANPNYAISFTDGTLVITPKPIHVTADSLSKVYGSADPALTYAANGLVGSDILSGAPARAPGETVPGGPYAITQGSLFNPNYTMTFVDGQLVITPKPIDVMANSAFKFEGGADPPLSYRVAGLVPGDMLIGQLARASGEAAGVYRITPGTLDDSNNPNYLIAFTDAALAISSLPPRAANSTVAAAVTDVADDTSSGKATNVPPRSSSDCLVRAETSVEGSTLSALQGQLNHAACSGRALHH